MRVDTPEPEAGTTGCVAAEAGQTDTTVLLDSCLLSGVSQASPWQDVDETGGNMKVDGVGERSGSPDVGVRVRSSCGLTQLSQSVCHSWNSGSSSSLKLQKKNDTKMLLEKGISNILDNIFGG